MGFALTCLLVLAAAPAEVPDAPQRTPAALELAAVTTVGTLPTAGPWQWGPALGALVKVDFARPGFGMGLDFEATRLFGGGAYYLAGFHYGMSVGRLYFGQRVLTGLSPDPGRHGAWVVSVCSGLTVEWALEPKLLDALGVPASLVLGAQGGTEIWLVGRADARFRGGLYVGVRL